MIILAKASTIIGIIRDYFLRGYTRSETEQTLRPLVTSQTEPFVFKSNESGRRVAKPIAEQYQMLHDQIGRIYSVLERDPIQPGEMETPPDDDRIPTPDSPDSENGASPTETENEPRNDRPVKKNRESETEQAERYYREFLRLREFCERRSESEPLDSLSYRPLKAGNRLIKAGFPVDGLLSQICLTWPEDAKREASVPKFDMAKYSREVMAAEGIDKITRRNGREETPHELFGAILTFARAGQPIWLIGPYGVGKSHSAKQVADYMQVSYGETPLSNGASRGDLLGRHTIGGLAETLATGQLASLRAMLHARYKRDGENLPDNLPELDALVDSLARISEDGAGGFVTSEFEQAYGNGGFFCFEELDSADAGMLLVVNNALESDELFNAVNGRVVAKSGSFVPIATGNTPGLGATRDYNTRERLDASTLDRWRMGRFFVGPDARVERAILFDGLAS